MGDGDAPVTESLWHCVVCTGMIDPRSDRRLYCSDLCKWRHDYAVQRTKPAAIEVKRDGCKRWRARNVSYHRVCCVLRKRGLLTDEARVALATLKGRGEATREEVRAVLRKLDLSPRSSPAPEVWIETGPTALERPSPDLTHLPVTAVRLAGPLPKRWHPGYVYRLFSAVARALKIPHRSDRPQHAVAHDHGAWWLLCWPEALAALPGSVRFITERPRYEETVLDTSGLRFRLRAPAPIAPGQYRVRVHLETPLVVRSSSMHKTIRRVRTDDLVDLRGSLSSLSDRLGVRYHESELHATILARAVETVETRLGGHIQRTDKRGTGVGLTGSLVVECNAPALWLLRAAERVGVGSDTARGFGRVRVEDV